MQKEISNFAIIPDSYATQNKSYNVLYLLHGAYGNHTNWVTKVPALKTYADQYNLIIICPDGGDNSWYFDSPIDQSMKYETFISSELITSVDKQYRTFANKRGRAITGLSMGGHGAFYLAFKHQDIWGAAGSMSGGLDIRPFPNNWNIADRLGNYTDHQQNWEQNTVINMIYLLDGKNLQLTSDCGVDDFFHDANKRMHQKLIERNIPHDYTERPGKHTWEYWSKSNINSFSSITIFTIRTNEQTKTNNPESGLLVEYVSTKSVISFNTNYSFPSKKSVSPNRSIRFSA